MLQHVEELTSTADSLTKSKLGCLPLLLVNIQNLTTTVIIINDETHLLGRELLLIDILQVHNLVSASSQSTNNAQAIVQLLVGFESLEDWARLLLRDELLHLWNIDELLLDNLLLSLLSLLETLARRARWRTAFLLIEVGDKAFARGRSRELAGAASSDAHGRGGHDAGRD